MEKLFNNKEWLYNEYIILGKSPYIISKEQNVDRAAITYWLKKYQIPIRNSKEAMSLWSNRKPLSLTQDAKDFIDGELLGDMHVAYTSKYTARIGYTSKYKEYLIWLSKYLKQFGIEQSGKIRKTIQPIETSFGGTIFSYISKSYDELLEFRNRWYINNKKIVPQEIELAPLVCRQWYIGDGNLLKNKKLIVNGYSICLATCGFEEYEIFMLIRKLQELGIKASFIKTKRIYITTSSVLDFLNYIGPCPIDCYAYKWRAIRDMTIKEEIYYEYIGYEENKEEYKIEIGDNVTYKNSLYGSLVGVVTKIHKRYKIAYIIINNKEIKIYTNLLYTVKTGLFDGL